MKQMKTSTLKLNCRKPPCRRAPVAWLIYSILVVGFLAFTNSMSAASSPLTDSFELDGDFTAVSPNPSDDWDLLYNGGANNGGSPVVFSGVLFDDANTSTDDNFTSGSKIDDLISKWKWTTGTVNDKQDLNHVAAALYNSNYNPITGAATGPATNLYFMADLIAGNGDA